MSTLFRLTAFADFFPALGRLFLPADSDQPFIARGLTVYASGIHGKGLFATRAFRRGTVLGRCKTTQSGEQGLYTLTIDDDETVDVVCDLKYINHSEDPNAVYFDDLTVVALRRIAPGEEITHNYGEEWLL